MERLKQAVPGGRIIESQLLMDYDSYYYSQDEQRPLPILRAKFDDPKQTWAYIDPSMGQVAANFIVAIAFNDGCTMDPIVSISHSGIETGRSGKSV